MELLVPVPANGISGVSQGNILRVLTSVTDKTRSEVLSSAAELHSHLPSAYLITGNLIEYILESTVDDASALIS